MDEDVINYCVDVVDRNNLGLLLEKNFKEPTLSYISHEDFKEMKFKTKLDFLKNFTLLTSPSVSHFLTYLEIYKNEFVLTKKQQKDFIMILNDFHVDNNGYLKIIMPKLECFGVIKA